MDNSGLDFSALQRLYQRNAAAMVVLDYFASREKMRWVTPLEDLESKVGALHRSDLISVLKELEKVGCGQFIVGRRGHQTRFNWSINAVDIAKKISGHQGVDEGEEEEEAAAAEGEEEEEGGDDEEEDEEVVEHRFLLRRDFEVKLSLPASLTRFEAERLADFIKTLPFN